MTKATLIKLLHYLLDKIGLGNRVISESAHHAEAIAARLQHSADALRNLATPNPSKENSK